VVEKPVSYPELHPRVESLLRRAYGPVRATCHGCVTSRFGSAHTACPGVRRIGTGRAPLVTGSRVACSGMTGDRRPKLGTLGEQVGAGRLIRPGSESDLPARAPDRSIPACTPAGVKAEIGCRVGLERGLGDKAGMRNGGSHPSTGRRGAGRQADSTERTGTPEACRRGLTGPEVRVDGAPHRGRLHGSGAARTGAAWVADSQCTGPGGRGRVAAIGGLTGERVVS
jgi:hypothetical protein